MVKDSRQVMKNNSSSSKFIVVVWYGMRLDYNNGHLLGLLFA
jgi:hypothetical protein